jgi:excisionase family DNA binding protein
MKSQKKLEVEKLVGFGEVSEVTGMSIPFIRKAQYKYGLPHYKIGNRVKFKMSEVFGWIEQRKAG